MVDDRKDHNRQQLTVLARWCAAILVVPALVGVLVITVASQRLWLGLIAGVVVYGAIILLAFRHTQRFGSGFVAGLDEGSVDEASAARLRNLTESLCIAHGVTKPTIRVIDADGRN
jgi:hypothetical protein